MFWRVVRGMIPHKTPRGAAALERLKTFEGVPPPYDHKKRMVVPQALRVLRLKPGRKYCTVGRLGAEFGWKYRDVVARYVLTSWSCWTDCNFLGILTSGHITDPYRCRLEERRKVKGAAYYERKQIARRQLAQAKQQVAEKDTETTTSLAQFGY